MRTKDPTCCVLADLGTLVQWTLRRCLLSGVSVLSDALVSRQVSSSLDLRVGPP